MATFEPQEYVSIIRLAKNLGYNCGGVTETVTSTQPYLALRHDVDFSLEYALDMATLEHDIGVSASYYIMSNCFYYNAHCSESLALIQQIKSLGHEIGFHWDSQKPFVEDPAIVADIINRELALFECSVGFEVKHLSQHEPTVSPPIPVNSLRGYDAYSFVLSGNFVYISDSSMEWRENGIKEGLHSLRNIQFLAHPIWWMTKGSSREEKLAEFKNKIWQSLLDGLENYEKKVAYVLENRLTLDDRFRQSRQQDTEKR